MNGAGARATDGMTPNLINCHQFLHLQPSHQRHIDTNATDKKIADYKFNQETSDFKFKSKWDEYLKEIKEFDEEWTKAF